MQGGQQIIFKYSGKSIKSSMDVDSRVTSPYLSRFPKRKSNTELPEKEAASRSNSPMLSPGRFLQDQGGIEGILQEAAKGVYNRGEKWGVTKAIRGAVQGLQSGSNTPRRAPEGTRWSLDEGRSVASNSSHFTARIKTLEDRNKALAKMLEDAMTDLAAQQKAFDKEKSETAADALSLAIAKIQFVQVYLEDSSIPLFPETAVEKAEDQPEAPPIPAPTIDAISVDEQRTLAIRTPAAVESIEILHHDATMQSENPNPIENPNPALTVLPADVKTQTTDSTTLPVATPSKPTLPHLPSFSPYKPRPSLAHSSFSWMLGEDKRKSSFVSASPFPPEKKRGGAARGKAGFLFGDEKGEGSEKEKEKGKGKKKGKDKKDVEKRSGRDRVEEEEEEEEEGFTLGTLRGIGKGESQIGP